MKKNLLADVRVVRNAAMASRRSSRQDEDYLRWRKLVDNEIIEITGMTSRQLSLGEDLPWRGMFESGTGPEGAARKILQVMEEQDYAGDDVDSEVDAIMDKFGIDERVVRAKSVDPKSDTLADILRAGMSYSDTDLVI